MVPWDLGARRCTSRILVRRFALFGQPLVLDRSACLPFLGDLFHLYHTADTFGHADAPDKKGFLITEKEDLQELIAKVRDRLPR